MKPRFLYTRRAARHAFAGAKPGGLLRHVDDGNGLALCNFHDNAFADPRGEPVHRDCPRCFRRAELTVAK